MPSRRVSGWPIFEPCRRWAGASVRRISGVMQRSDLYGEWGSRQGGNALRRSGRREAEGAHDDAPRELDLEFVVAGRLRVSERRFGGAPEAFGLRHQPRQQLLSLARPPGLGGDAAERNAGLGDLA